MKRPLRLRRVMQPPLRPDGCFLWNPKNHLIELFLLPWWVLRLDTYRGSNNLFFPSLLFLSCLKIHTKKTKNSGCPPNMAPTTFSFPPFFFFLVSKFIQKKQKTLVVHPTWLQQPFLSLPPFSFLSQNSCKKKKKL